MINIDASHLVPQQLERPVEPSMIPVAKSPLGRLLFRFALVYWFLFIVPLPPLWLAIVPWAGRHLFHVDASVRYSFQAFLGAGDSTFHYVQVFCALLLAAIVAVARPEGSHRLQ